MKTRTVFLAPGSLQPDMVTAASIHGRRGEELLAPDSVLDEALIDSIRRRGIRCILVRVPDERDEAAIARDLHGAEARIEHIFRGSGSEARRELQQAVAEFRRSQAG